LASTVTVVATEATATATAEKTAAPVATAANSDETMPEKPETTELSGFEGAIAIAGLLTIGYVVMRQKR